MDVRLSPEQQALRDSVAAVVERLAPTTVASLGDPERADKLEAAVVASGWRELRVAEEDGSPLASAVEVAIVAEELGRGLADTAFVGPTLAAELRRLAGAPAATTAETVAFASGLGAIGRAGDDELVAFDAAGATHALVLVPTDEGVGYRLGRIAIDGDDTSADLTRRAVVVAATSSVDGVEGQERVLDDEAVVRCTALGLAVASADLVGVMRGAVDLAVGYVSAREQFGRPVGSFQAVQHLLADAFVLMEGSRSAALHAAWAVDGLAPDDALAAAAVAKAYAARAGRTVGETVIQVHGGIGNTWECLAHVFLRRALVSGDLLGGVGPSLQRVLAHRGIGGGDGLP
jgi:alkylation response protein AidB-like acyl-CoA dehydrogenase